MKRLFYLVCIIGLPLIGFFQYDNYRRHHPESVYAYPVSDSIDNDYHDPDKVLRYYQLTEEIGAYGRYCYKEHGVDVLRADNTDPEAGPLATRYQQLVAAARHLESKLEHSAELKAQGLHNEAIFAQEQGLTFSSMDANEDQVLARINDQGPIIEAVQQKLAEKGMQLLVDGLFRAETEQKIREFQQQVGLTPTGLLDIKTFRQLWAGP